MQDNLPDNGFVLPAEIADEHIPFSSFNSSIASQEIGITKHEISVPAKYWPGVAYTSSVGEAPELTEEQLESVKTGVQDHAIAPSKEAIEATEAYQIAIKVQKQSAHKVAFEAQKKRVSRRLLLVERAKKLTVVCPTTGIVSLIEIPAIPAKALVYSHPLAELDNCRGIAQQGFDYLNRLDTQVLAGVLIVLADCYELFRFQPFDTGAQKNALLRTASKQHLIEAIILIENLIHSNNAKYLPKLSLILDSNVEDFGLHIRMQNYLKLLAEAIAEPDKEAYDPNFIKKVGKPVYIRDEEKKERKISFLARQEISRAKKQYAEDRKAGKAAIAELCKVAKVTDKLRALLLQLMAEDALLSIPSIWVDKICERLTQYNLPVADKLLEILKRDRKALLLDVSELEETIQAKQAEEEEQDDPKPGQEEAVEDFSNGVDLSKTEMADEVPLEDHTGIDSESMGSDLPIQVEAEEELMPPPGLNKIQEILWRKKIKEAKGRTFTQTAIPSVATYTPSATKETLGKE